MKAIIFSDLDGSLLNHEDYSFAAARPSIARIKRTGIPLIITTSKTRMEVELLQQDMGIREPFIVENGGGIFFPYGYLDFMIENGEWDGDYTLIRIGTTYSTIRNFLKKVGARFEIRGFGDLTAEEISELTSLAPDRAEMAKAREFTEPFLLKRPDGIGCLSALAAEKELKVTRGGRFHHLIGREQDKGVAVRMVIDIFKINSGEELRTIGIGDSENDLPMLEQVDIPVLIPRPGKGYLDIQLPGVIRAKEPGARGWNDVIQMLLNEQSEITTKES